MANAGFALLRRIDAEAGHFGQALHRVVVVREQLRHLVIELSEVVFDHAQFFQRELHQSPIHRVEIGARAKGIAQLVGVARKRESASAARAVGSLSPSAKACSMRRALVPSRSDTTLETLMWASSRSDSSRLWS
jgi:hypothetical protein